MNNVVALPQEDLEGLDQPLGLDTVKASVPKGRRHIITQGLVDTINGVVDDPEVRDAFRSNLLGFTDVLQDPKITVTAYIQAVRFVSYKLMGYQDLQSYIKTFPERYERMIDDGKSIEHIRAIVSQYNAGKTVNMILEQVMVPTHVLNYDIFQEAVNTQREIMMDTGVNAKTRSDAAHSLLTTLKQPEVTKMKLEVDVKETDTVRELQEVTLSLAKKQQELIESGITNAKEVAEATLVPGSCERIE